MCEAFGYGPRLVEKCFQATSKFEAAGGRSMERKIEDVLTGLGFSSAVPRRAQSMFVCLMTEACRLESAQTPPNSAKDFEKSCSELSGGWQMRVRALDLSLLWPSSTILYGRLKHTALCKQKHAHV